VSAEAAVEQQCSTFPRTVRPGYRLRGGELSCWRHVALHRTVWRRAVVTALIVGTIVTAINQGNLILSHGFTHEILLKMALTYCVPFFVSTSGALGAARVHSGG